MDDENRGRLKTILILCAVVAVIVIYAIGLFAQYAQPPVVQPDGWGETIASEVSFNPFVCLVKAFTTSIGRWAMLSLIILGGVIFMWKKFSHDGEDLQDERQFSKSRKGTYGTSGWMTDEELRANLSLLPIQKTTGTILGTKDGKIVSLPIDSRLNKHTAIYGASGTGKSRCFVRPQILQCVSRGESIIITDPKGEIYADTAEFLRKEGYDVKVFNLVDPQHSDSWNCMAEIVADPDQIELMAQTFVDVIIKNTSGEKPDHFWDNSEASLLKALCLYIATDPTRSVIAKNIGAAYEMLTNNDEKKLTAIFDKLPIGHPAKQPWNVYRKGGDTVRGNVIIGLGVRLQVFQADIIRRITTYSEIDLEAPARKKCAYFVIMSDQDSTLDFLSSLFFSFLFIRLVRYADIKGKDGKCDVPVNFILDEFPNIGQIPDFTKKLSTIRSRDLRVAVIFQNVAQLQNRYPMGLWEEIIGNCDTQLFLGCTDQMTAKFISERTGEMTIDVNSSSVTKQSIAVTQTIPDYKETQSVGKRYVLTPDEVLRLESNKALVIIRGQKVLKVNKFDYSNHPGAKQFIHTYIKDYIPEWRAQQATKRFSSDDAQASINRVRNTTYAYTDGVANDYDMPESALDMSKSDAPVSTTARRQSSRRERMQNTNDINELISMANEEDEPRVQNVIGLDGSPKIREFSRRTPSKKQGFSKISQDDDDIDF